MEPRIQFAKTEDGVSIAYWTMGKGTPLLVTPHSPMSWSLRSWQNPEARAYYEKVTQGRLVIHYDHRGTGNSEHDISEQSIETLVADMEAVANDVGLEEFALCGSYICAPYAIAYAARHSERISKLIVLHASARGADFFNVDRLRKARESADEDPEFYLQIIAHQVHGGFGGKQAESWVSEVLKVGNPHVLQMTLDTIIETDVMELLPEVEAATLVLHRREAQYPSLDAARTLAGGIPSAQLVVLEGDSLVHYSGDSDSFVSAINEFLGAGPAAYGRGAAADTTRISSPPEAKTFDSGRYVVVRLLGQGAQKSVYLVDDTRLGRQCALSMLNPALLDPGDIDRLKREAQTMAQFGTQPNIVTVYDQGEEDGAPFIVCEYVPGGELRGELAAAAGPLPLERALGVATDICRALSFAHGRDIVHRDLKPENVWLTEERTAKLGDFGIALTAGRTRLTMPGSVSGTALYMAPEQASGGEIDSRTDLYALGVLLYELVTGSPPFLGDDPNAIMYQHINNAPESPSAHNGEVPPQLEQLIMRLLAKPKAERPGSAEEVLAELEHVAVELVGGLADVHTILFTDMASSTALTEQLGDAGAQEVRRAHNEIVRGALSANGGNEIKHTGDGIMASFATASSALDSAIAIQRGVAAHKQEYPDSRLGVYVGLNAGEPIAEDDDLFGTSVNLAARICDHAEAGQILAANVVRELAAGKQFLFADLGETELRGFEDPVRLYEVRWREAG